MKVCEIFVSIQGESSYVGLPCTFVRLTGCNLRCSYCDTTYAYAEGEDRTEEEIVREVSKAGIPLVEITGGEPLLQQEEMLDLTARLIDAGYDVLIETNGSVSIRPIDSRAVVIMDVKAPASGMSEKNDFSNFACVKQKDEIKFVLSDRNDYVWSRSIVQGYGLAKRCTVLFSPAYGALLPRELAGWIVKDRLAVRLNLQLHKYIYGPEERMV